MLWADWLDDVGGFMANPFILIPLILLFLGLIGLFIWQRMKKKDDE